SVTPSRPTSSGPRTLWTTLSPTPSPTLSPSAEARSAAGFTPAERRGGCGGRGTAPPTSDARKPRRRNSGLPQDVFLEVPGDGGLALDRLVHHVRDGGRVVPGASVFHRRLARADRLDEAGHVQHRRVGPHLAPGLALAFHLRGPCVRHLELLHRGIGPVGLLEG